MKHIGTLLILSVLSSSLHAQDLKTIKLKQQHAAYSPRNYYITSVKDDRADTGNIGRVHIGLANREVYVNLKNGAASALDEYIQHNVTQDKKAVPVNIHISKLNVGEKIGFSREQAELELELFYYKGDSQLVAYTGSGYIQHGIDVTGYVEQMIRQNIDHSLEEFDKWMDENGQSPTNAPEVVAEVIVQQGAAGDTDLVNYDRNRPLQREDFSGEPDDLSLGAAATYSNIAMKYSAQRIGNIVNLKVTISASFDKTRSWWRSKNSPPGMMIHEQHHFDITGIKACELANSVKSTRFSTSNYQQELEDLHKKIIKEMQQMQSSYDKETQHGRIKTEQERWNKFIKEQADAMSCY